MEDIKKMLQEEQKKLAGVSNPYPFPKIQIDQEGKFVLRNGSEVQDLGSEIDFIFLKKYGEYIHFDPEKERITKRTTLEENPQEAKEIFSRVSTQELRDAGYDMKFIGHYIGYLVSDGKLIPATLILKGSGVKSFIDFTSENKDYMRNRMLNVLHIGLEQRKKGAVKYYAPTFETRDITDEEAKQLLGAYQEDLKKFEEFRSKYNEPRSATTTTEETSIPDVSPEDIGTEEDALF